MKGLNTLIKLHKRTLDELRRKMAALENQKIQLLQASARLDEELASEIKTASKTPELGQFFGGFSNRIKNRQLDIAREVAKLDKQIEALNSEIRDAFSELKKFEIALENAKLKLKAAQERMLTIEMDEIAQQKTEDS